MRTTRVLGLALATFGGSLAACNFAIGFHDYDFGSSGSGAGMSTSTSTGTAGVDGGGDAGADAGPTGRGVWSYDFAGPTVSAIAAGPKGTGTVYLTGTNATGPAFNCTNTSDAGSSSGTGYLVQLDGSGNCLWGFFFGESAQGTGVAVDTKGDVVVTAQFIAGGVDLNGNWPPNPNFNQTNSFVALFDANHNLMWGLALGDSTGQQGNQMATAVAINDQTVVASASYTSWIGVVPPPGSPGSVAIETMSDGTDSVVIRFDSGGTPGAPLSITSMMGTTQLANAVAVDSSGNVAVAGTTTGPTTFNGIMPPLPAPMVTPSLFLASWESDGGVPLAVDLGGNPAPGGGRVAFDAAGNILVGGTFTSLLDAGTGDGGDAGSAPGGQSVFVTHYPATGTTPLGTIQFVSSVPDDTATLAGIAPFASADAGASVTCAGSYQGTVQFPGSPSIVNQAGVSAVYVAKVDGALDKVIWVESYGDGIFNQVVDAVAVDPSDGTILVAGHYQGSLAFGGMATPSLSNMTGSDKLFVAKLSP